MSLELIAIAAFVCGIIWLNVASRQYLNSLPPEERADVEREIDEDRHIVG